MAKLHCPKCGAVAPSPDGWAKAALSTLMQSPAVPHMATQIRCQDCRHVFTQFDAVQRTGWRAFVPAALLIAVLLTLAVLLPR